MKCASHRCDNEVAFRTSKGLFVCERCYEELELALPYVTWRQRFKNWRNR